MTTEQVDSTTQSDVPNTAPTTTESAEPQKTAREIEMERIEARHQEQLARENGLDLAAAEPAAADQLAAQLNDTGDAPPAAPASAPAAAADTPPAKVKVKIDGVEAEVPFEEVVKNYQKTAAADRRMQEAARVQREALELQQQLIAQQQQLAAQLTQQPPGATTATGAPTESEPDDGADKEFLRALFEGDEETARAKLNALMQGRQQANVPAQPTLDLNQLTEQVAAQVQHKLIVERALQQHRQDYPEIYADPDMEGFTLTKVQSLRAAEPHLDFFTALNTVSADLATKFGWKDAATPGREAHAEPTTNTRVAKLERKQQIDNLSTANTKTTTTEPVPEDPSTIIKQMQEARLGR